MRGGTIGRRLLVAGLLTGAMTVLGTGPAQAAPAWVATKNLTGVERSITSVAAASDVRGDVVAGWIRYDGTNYIVELATRTAGGTFQVRPIQTGTGSASNLTIDVNARGDALVGWRRNDATAEIWATTRSRLGGFSTPQAVASVPGATVNEPNVAVADNGAMMVVWWLEAGSLETVYGAYRAPGGSFQTAPISSSDRWNQSPRVVLDSAGRATVVWSYWNGTDTNITRVRVRAPDGTFGTQRDLSAGAPTGFPMFATVGLDRNGDAIAIWSHWNGSTYDVTGATRAAASDNWNALPVFGQSAGASFGNEPQVAVDPAGNAVALWRGADGTIQASSRSAGGSFGPPQTGISQPSAQNPRVALDPSGTATAVWQRQDPDGFRIEAATRPLERAFGAVKTLSGATSAAAPALAVDGVGNALAMWSYQDATVAPGNNNNLTQYAVRDVSRPTITIDGPESGTVGRALTFTARTFDVWSPVSTAWSFGDGARAQGGSVRHAFGGALAFTVAATATDAVGNTASATKEVRVSRPGAPPKMVGAKVATGWKVKGARLTLTKLTLKKLPKGWTAKATCKGKKCPFKSRKLTNRKVKSGTWKALKPLGEKRTFRAGQTFEVRIGAPNRSTKVVRSTLKKGRKPKGRTLCLPPGAKQPAKSCS